MTWEAFFGYLTCLGFVSTDMDLATLARTAAVVNVCNAIVCRLIAHNNGRNATGWTAAGFFFGFWAVAAALLLTAGNPFGDDESGR